ncbi:NAD(P)H-hydrate dehydratase [uncultured Bradyrhizobium sp.]|uniref:NAD(P)H-hydrate dehydratase n=1 Tax=uncultured Bradyrhizobium sp. TaxID=199684 RepID=UPI0035CB9066
MNAVRVTRPFLKAHPLPRHEENSDKQARGRALVIAGSVEVPGAALLAGLGVLRAGAGILQIATCRSAAHHLAMAMPEAMVVGCAETLAGGIDPASLQRLARLGSDCDAVLIGPGMVDEAAVAELTLELLKQLERPVVVLDASAFATLKMDGMTAGRDGRIVVTPHSGEMATFLDVARKEVDGDPLSAARQAAETLRAVVAMKGASTYVVSPDREAWLCENGSIALATSGSGDTLAGILAGLLARGTDPALATIWAVYLHGEAGRRLAKKNGTYGLLAREIPDEIPIIMQELSGVTIA